LGVKTGSTNKQQGWMLSPKNCYDTKSKKPSVKINSYRK
jgi:hypothetical protein